VTGRPGSVRVATLPRRRAHEGLPRGSVLARLPAWVRAEIDLRSSESLACGREKIARIGRTTVRVASWRPRCDEDYLVQLS